MTTCVLSNRCERRFNMVLRCGGVDLSTAREDEYISTEQIQCCYLFPNPVDPPGLDLTLTFKRFDSDFRRYIFFSEL